MNFLWNLAKKNLSRSRTRTMISIVAIAFAVMSVVFARSFITGMLNSTYENHLYYKAGHIKVIDKEYQLKERILPLDYTVDGFNQEGYLPIAEELKQIEGVEQVVPRLKFGAIVSMEDELVNMVGWGVDPLEEIKFTGIDKIISEGRMIEKGKREVVIGADLLEKIDRQVGGKVTFLYNTSYDSFQASTFSIVGKIESNIQFINETLFYLPLEQAQDILGMAGEVTELLLVTPDYQKVASFLPAVNALFARKDPSNRYIVQPWDKGYDMIEYIIMASGLYNTIYVIIILLACFVLINTLIMIVNERKREIGMMSALGLKAREILTLFTMEGVIIGLMGSAAGAVLGGIISKIISVVGIDFSAMMEGMSSSDLMMPPIFYADFSLENIIFSFVLGVVIVTIACMIPARQAARLEPTEALR